MIDAMDTFEFMDGVLRFNIWLLLLNSILLLICVLEWYRMYKLKGIILDYKSGFYAIYIIIPILIMYPFSGAYYNIISVGGDIIWIMEKVDIAYVISIIGVLFMMLGAKVTPILSVDNGVFERIIKTNLENHKFEKFIGICSLFMLMGLLAICYKYPAYIFNIRAIRFIDPSLGILINLILSYAVTSLLITLVLMVRKITFERIVLLISVVLISLLMGNRMTLIMPVITISSIYLMGRRKVRIYRFIIGVVMVAAVTILLSLLRSSTLDEYDTMYTQEPTLMFFAELLYGNTFSDLRDFAWVLTGFNDAFLYGKTYLAGILGFIPSSMFEYRAIYGIGDITNHYAGIQFDHFGLRTGVFGESYINFGLPGVVITGFTVGNLLASTNKVLEKILHEKMDIAYAYSRTFKLYAVSSCLMISANLTVFYVFILTHIIGYVVCSKLIWKGNKTSVNS